MLLQNTHASLHNQKCGNPMRLPTRHDEPDKNPENPIQLVSRFLGRYSDRTKASRGNLQFMLLICGKCQTGIDHFLGDFFKIFHDL